MTQQTSPFLDANYGWEYGENGWNTGMDENIIKFSFMFDKNIDSVVSVLPSAVSGQAHFLTTDNRLYFAVGSTYYSSPTPKWCVITLKSTGQTYQFDGASLSIIDSPLETNSRLDVLELTTASLGSAAFNNVEFFATKTELDVSESVSSAYTDALEQKLSSSLVYEGSAMIGRQPLQINDVAELRATPGRFSGDRCFLNNYLAGDGKGARGGTWVTGASTDNGGTHFAATGGTWVMDLTEDGMISADFWGLPLASGFSNVEFAAIEAYMYANKVSCNVGPGIYDFGPGKAPFTNRETSATFRDYGGIGLYCTTETIFQTTSPSGADVFNFVCVSGFNIWGYPTITAHLTSYLDSGSNGTSFVHGAKDMTIEANYVNLPFVDKGGAAVDGGSAFTLQANATSLLPFENITVRGSAKNVSHGVTCSGTYEYFVSKPVKGVVIDNLRVERAYRALVISSTAPAAAPATPPHIGLTGRMHTINCQQVLFDGRGDGVHMDIAVMNTLVKESLNVLPSDPLVTVVRLLGAKNFNYNVHGEIRSADTWLQIGGTAMGFAVIGDTSGGVLRQSVKYNAVTTTIDLVTVGGANIKNNEIHLNGITSGYSGISALSGSLFVNGQKVHPTVYPGDAAAIVHRNSYTQVLFTDPLTAARAVPLPTPANIGDIVFTSRLASATGVGSMQVLGINYPVSTWAEFVYNGSTWVRSKTGTV